MATKHSPAFDYNILQLDSIILDVQKNYKNYLAYTNVRYDPPDSLYAKLVFVKNDELKSVKIYWQVHQLHDRFRVANNVWTLEIDDTIEKNKTIGYIYKKIGEALA